MNERIEKDFLGKLKGGKGVYWEVNTQRALENFRISGIKFSFEFIKVIVLIKKYATEVNKELGLIDEYLEELSLWGCYRYRD